MPLRTVLLDLWSALSMARKSLTLMIRNWRPLVRLYRHRHLLNGLAYLIHECDTCGPNGYCEYHTNLRDEIVTAAMEDETSDGLAALTAVIEANAETSPDASETDTDSTDNDDNDLPDRGIQ